MQREDLQRADHRILIVDGVNLSAGSISIFQGEPKY